MEIIDLYRYTGKDGKSTVDTIVLLDCEHEKRKRIKAGKGKHLKRGDQRGPVFDIPAKDIDKWSEVDAEEGEE